MSELPPYVLVCSLCGQQRELPTPGEPSGPTRDGFLHCSPPCKGTTFSLRMRVPLVKAAPAP